MSFYILVKTDIIDHMILKFSYSWGDFSDIWYVGRDLFGMSSIDAQKNLNRAISKLTEMNIQDIDIDPRDPNWLCCRQPNGEQMTMIQRLEIFKKLLNGFLDVAKEYPTATFYNTDL